MVLGFDFFKAFMFTNIGFVMVLGYFVYEFRLFYCTDKHIDVLPFMNKDMVEILEIFSLLPDKQYIHIFTT